MITDAHINQQEKFFSIPQNFCRKLKVGTVRAWGFDYRDVGLWYVVMHDMGRQSRRFGHFGTTVRLFVEQCGGVAYQEDDAAHAELWLAFQEAGIVDLDGDPAGMDQRGTPTTFRVTVLDMHDVNRASPEPVTGKERTAKWRAGKRDAVTPANPPHNPECDAKRDARDVAVTRDATEETEETEKKNDGLRVHAHVREAGDEGTNPGDTTAKLAKARRQLGSLAHLGDELASLLAARTPGESVPPTRALSKLWGPLARMVAEFDRDDLRAGLDAAIKAGAPEPAYVRKAATSHEQKRLNDDNTKPRRGNNDTGTGPGKYDHLGTRGTT